MRIVLIVLYSLFLLSMGALFHEEIGKAIGHIDRRIHSHG